MRDALAEVDDLGEEEVDDPEEQKRSHQRPEVAQHRAEVAELELGAGERDRQLEHAPSAPSERRGSVPADCVRAHGPAS